jgi:hypothetical protein
MHSADSARFAALGHTPIRQPPYPPPPTYVWAQQSTGTGNVATPNNSQCQIEWCQALLVLGTGYQRGNVGLGVPLGHCFGMSYTSCSHCFPMGVIWHMTSNCSTSHLATVVALMQSQHRMACCDERCKLLRRVVSTIYHGCAAHAGRTLPQRLWNRC